MAASLKASSEVAAESRWRAGIDGHALVVGRQRERGHVTPVRADERLDLARDGQAVLRDLALECERLPAAGIGHHRPRLGDDQRLIERSVRIVHVALRLERAVGRAIGDQRLGDAVAQRRRVVALGRGVVGAVAEGVHGLGQLLVGLIELGDLEVPPQQNPIGREADGRFPSGGHVRRGLLLRDEVAVGLIVIRRPGVPHGGREVEQVAGVHGRRGHDLANQGKKLVVPDSGRRVAVALRGRAVLDDVGEVGLAGRECDQQSDQHGQHHRATSWQGASTTVDGLLLGGVALVRWAPVSSGEDAGRATARQPEHQPPPAEDPRRVRHNWRVATWNLDR